MTADAALIDTKTKLRRFWLFLRKVLLNWRAAKWLSLSGLVIAVLVLLAAFIYYIRATKDLPTLQALADYKPPVMTRMHAGDGKLITEFSQQARVFVPVETIPIALQQAFIAAEDKRFYRHKGWDPIGLTRAALTAPAKKLKKQRIGGTSTITQQVAKNFLVGDDYSMRRKVREIAIARRMEKALSKDQIIELYLNEIYFGRGAYGVAAASLKHFGRPMKDLSLAQMTYLASVPKGPANYRLDDERGYQKAKYRQAYILGRMVEDEYITQDQADAAKAADLDWVSRLEGAEFLAAEYFVEEARKTIYKLYGQDELYSGGLSIRTTLDTQMQLAGRRALRRGIENFDRRHGYRGPLAHWDSLDDWKKRLGDFNAPKDIADWRVAIVLKTTDKSAKLGFAPDIAETDIEQDSPDSIEDASQDNSALNQDDKGQLNLSDISWAAKALSRGRVTNKPKSVKDVVKTGDIILVQRKAPAKDGKPSTDYNLRQIPKVNGGLIAMDPHTGRVLTLIGGYSFEQSEFNRATQAYRQPGSAFKPFVYAAALESGFTPASQVLDAPFVIERQDVQCSKGARGNLELRGAQENRDAGRVNAAASNSDQCERFYKPSNYNAGKFYGLSTLRLGLEKSRNAMTVRLANDIGMKPIIDIGTNFGIYDEVRPELAWALGAGETNLIRLAAAYSMMINGGKYVEPAILDRVQDGTGKTIFLNGDLRCEFCQQEDYLGGPPPELPDFRRQVIDPVTAYQVTFMMQGVVENGTGFRLRPLERPLGGKTGTTNDSFDAWFMGFSPDLVVGVYVGMDRPEQMGNETGSSAAAPIVADFMTEVLAKSPKVPFRIPEGVTLAPINRITGEPSYIGAPDFILEAFRPGTEPSLGSLNSTIRVGSGAQDSFSLYSRDAAVNDTPFDEFSYDDDFASDEGFNDAPKISDGLIAERQPPNGDFDTGPDALRNQPNQAPVNNGQRNDGAIAPQDLGEQQSEDLADDLAEASDNASDDALGDDRKIQPPANGDNDDAEALQDPDESSLGPQESSAGGPENPDSTKSETTKPETIDPQTDNLNNSDSDADIFAGQPPSAQNTDPDIGQDSAIGQDTDPVTPPEDSSPEARAPQELQGEQGAPQDKAQEQFGGTPKNDTNLNDTNLDDADLDDGLY